MASSLDIAPALGHGIVTAQNQAGGYDAIDDRRQWAVGRQEGATTSAAYKVTEKAEGANLSVDVATDGGAFLVQGDDVDWQGLYLIPPMALKANLNLEDAPDPTNPRVDFVVLEARDDAHTQDGITRGRVYVLSGTPTSGADVVDSAEYEASKPDLPNSTALLAEFVVAANAATIGDVDIRDRRSWAVGAYHRISRAAGANYTHTSATYTLIDSANLNPRIECTGNPIRISIRGQVFATGSDAIEFSPFIDGQIAEGIGDALSIQQGAGLNAPLDFNWTLIPEPGSHTLGWAWRTTLGGKVTLSSSTANPVQMEVEEILRPNASN